MRPPYLISTLDRGKDISLYEMIKDTDLREKVLKLKESILIEGSDFSSTLTHKNYQFRVTPIFSMETTSPASGYMLIVTTSQSNSIASLYDTGAAKSSTDKLMLKIEKDEDLPITVEKVIRLCREQFGLTIDKIRDILTGKQDMLDKVVKVERDE